MKEFRELFKYGTWANVALIDHCSQLPPKANEAAAEGTFGSIGDTFVHMVEQERWGLWVLGRKLPDFKDSSWESLRSTFTLHGEMWQDVLDNFEELTDTPFPQRSNGSHPYRNSL